MSHKHFYNIAYSLIEPSQEQIDAGNDYRVNTPNFCYQKRVGLGWLRLNRYPTEGTEKRCVLSKPSHISVVGTILDGLPYELLADHKVSMAADEWTDPEE